jgi:hypothetical protein
MKISLYLSVKRRELALRDALIAGFEKHGDTVTPKLRKEFWSHWKDNKSDLVVYVGVKSRKMWNVCIENKQPMLLIDKGYFGRAEYHRMSLGGYQPPYLNDMELEPNRLKQLGVTLHPKREKGNIVLYAGSSHKYCMFHGLGDVSAYAAKVCAEIQQQLKAIDSSLTVVYRPKPSWWGNDDDEIDKTVPVGTVLSAPQENFAQILKSCHCLVTHGSNAGIEALAAGVPVILTSGPGISPIYDLAEHDMTNIGKPAWPRDSERLRVLSALAWCQYNIKEIASGFAWANLKPWLNR